MTSKKVMLTTLILAAAFTALAGCSEKTRQPSALNSPYPAPKLWAVAPFRNESGTTTADGLALADKLTQQLQQVPGIRLVPVNRVLESFAANRMNDITSVNEAEQIMRTLGADGLIIGTITAWDPYDPPKIGVAMDLYKRRAQQATAINTRKLTRAASSNDLPNLIVHEKPVAQAGTYFDAANGNVRQNLTAYAYGRAPQDSPAGWRKYLLSIDLYSEFVAHELARELFSSEWQRLTIERQQLAEANARQQNQQPTQTTDPTLTALGSRLNR